MKFEPSTSPEQQRSIIEGTGYLSNAVLDAPLIHGFVACSLKTNIDFATAKANLAQLNGVRFVEPFYRLPSGEPFTVGESFVVGFKEWVTPAKIDSINASFNVEICGRCPYRSQVYYIRKTPSSEAGILELANEYYELSCTRFALPNFCHAIVPDSYRLFDYYADFQWQIRRVIGAYDSASVWDYHGLNDTVIVAVLDDGLDSHEDIPQARILPGYDFANAPGDPAPAQYFSHGMACAGIIGASHTTDSVSGLSKSSGVISLNPHVLLLPVGVIPECPVGPDTGRAMGILFASSQGADILSCSWHLDRPNDDIADAIEHVYTYGRLTLGCPIIFSAGNVSRKFAPCRQVAFPGRLPQCFSVASVDEFDSSWYYNCHDSTLDIVAPSADWDGTGDFWSTDQMWSNKGTNSQFISDCPPGDNNPNYECHFGGTSAACAIVSGVASLILAKCPTLRVEEVYDILRRSAVTDLSQVITPPDTAYGWGRVDAFRAILSLSHGDVNNDGDISILDVTYLTSYFYRHGPAPFPSERLADVDCSGSLDPDDITYLVDYAFRHGPPPPAPCFEF